MSKKSRKRNKKILAAIGIGLGAAALASRKPKQSSTEASSGRDGDSASAIARRNANKDTATKPIAKPDTAKKTDYITKKDTSKKVSVPVGKMKGAGTDASAIAGQKTRADYAQSKRAEQADETSVENYPTDTYIKPYNPKGRFNRKDGGRMGLKSGGSARGAGCAKRGVSKILLKGKR